jgi:ABC-type transporter Mla subunit MlaD
MPEPAESPAPDLGEIAASLGQLHRAANRLAVMAADQADRDRATRRQLDHLDEMLHQIVQFIDENRAALERATVLLDPGAPMRQFLRKRPKVGTNGQG